MTRSVTLASIFGFCASASLFAGCGEMRGAISAPNSMLQIHARGNGPAPKRTLLYVTSHTATFAYVYLFSYPQGQLVGKIAKQITGLCSDSHGNVYMTQSYNRSTSTIFEYAHDAMKPMAILSDPYAGASSCAVDPTTGNLAVANSYGSNVVIYQHARGKPKEYYTPDSDYVAYDPMGHLYALGGEGTAFALFDSGQFKRVSLNKHVEESMGVQWDGKYMAIGDAGSTYHNNAIRQYTITGQHGVEEGFVKLGEQGNYFYIDGSNIVVSSPNDDNIYIFAYPGGGRYRAV